MKYTTATFTVAMGNVLPAFAFLMAWVLRYSKLYIRYLYIWCIQIYFSTINLTNKFETHLDRLEKVNIRSLHSIAKVLGTAAAVGGAMFMTMVKGPILNLPWDRKANRYQQESTKTLVNKHDTLMGALMITAGYACWSAFIILQVRLTCTSTSQTKPIPLLINLIKNTYSKTV